MDGILVNNIINASIDNANRIGNVHQYLTKSFFIIITTEFRFIYYFLFPIAFNHIRTVFTEQVRQWQIAFLISNCIEF